MTNDVKPNISSRFYEQYQEEFFYHFLDNAYLERHNYQIPNQDLLLVEQYLKKSDDETANFLKQNPHIIEVAVAYFLKSIIESFKALNNALYNDLTFYGNFKAFDKIHAARSAEEAEQAYRELLLKRSQSNTNHFVNILKDIHYKLILAVKYTHTADDIHFFNKKIKALSKFKDATNLAINKVNELGQEFHRNLNHALEVNTDPELLELRSQLDTLKGKANRQVTSTDISSNNDRSKSTQISSTFFKPVLQNVVPTIQALETDKPTFADHYLAKVKICQLLNELGETPDYNFSYLKPHHKLEAFACVILQYNDYLNEIYENDYAAYKKNHEETYKKIIYLADVLQIGYGKKDYNFPIMFRL